jgi:4-amino-4-deoxy-L-arabinose transferase-like glycosyltransferase
LDASISKPALRSRDLTLLALLGAALTLLHIAVNNRYGFHRDELLSLDNARHLAWGYVVYPPLTPFLARIELVLFGPSLRGFRFFVAVAQGLAPLFTGLAARAIGARRWAQLVAASAVSITGFSLVNGSFMSYASLDYLWWILAGWALVRLLGFQNPRWWIAAGAFIGLGLMTRYTMGLLILGILGGLAFTPARRWFRSPWFWGAAALAFLLCLPNFLWQLHHHFIWLQWIHSIHRRDMGRGWTDSFLLNQFWKTTNSMTVPLWLAGLWFLFAARDGRPWRLLGWMYAIPFLVLLALHGRDYYLAPAYPMLFAAGAVQIERWLPSLRPGTAREVRRFIAIAFPISGVVVAALTLPIAPPGSAWWTLADSANSVFKSQFGWPEMVATIAQVRDALPAQDKDHLAILVGDDGETGAIDLYGSAYHLPQAISGMNSAWYRSYGDPPPQTVLAVNMDPDFLGRSFTSCRVAARLPHPRGIVNDTILTDEIYVCRGLRTPWPQFWATFHYYG